MSFVTIETPKLERNSFISKDSGYIIKLNLQNKNIKTVAPGAFTNLDCLHYLNLSENEIEEIEEKTFEDVSRLLELNLSFNKISLVKDYSFMKLRELRFLDLSHNQIETIKLNSFATLRSLKILNITSNKLNVIDVNTFRYTLALEELLLGNNKLEYFEMKGLSILKNLKRLNVDNNRLNTFDSSGNFQIESLKEIEINGNNLTRLNVFEFRKSYPSVEVLGLNNNYFDCDDLKYIIKGLADSRLKIIGNETIRRNEAGIFCVEKHSAAITTITPTTSTSDIYEGKSYEHLKDEVYSLKTWLIILGTLSCVLIFLYVFFKSNFGKSCILKIRECLYGEDVSNVENRSLLI